MHIVSWQLTEGRMTVYLEVIMKNTLSVSTHRAFRHYQNAIRLNH
ncbi:protein of unknown function [Xenorhabdus nematophila AN6/1]|nr:hypothetical protein XNA1_2990017 [Xenorhabdus nematophila str. Anatoliense]CEE92659.1 hypothetical protein XNA1_300017 [Xenorhabdus nematophila str. Anatoliense]CEF30240.1 hypothetical protein XNW1_2370024 [Xenorhabdus nematophila str. Websteri]CEF30676.1 hypothetical protein XNW1_280024 [Xenorhabdus nematophila str. Websteri]CEK21747.1 protein of unknown function [Xenorhabdus nematophila AN6/1]